MIDRIVYWQYGKNLEIKYKFTIKLDSEFSNNQTIPDNEVKIINYLGANIERLLERRGFTLDNCCLFTQIDHRVGFGYMPDDGDLYAINEKDTGGLNKVEQEVIAKIKELKEQENEG